MFFHIVFFKYLSFKWGRVSKEITRRVEGTAFEHTCSDSERCFVPLYRGNENYGDNNGVNPSTCFPVCACTPTCLSLKSRNH